MRLPAIPALVALLTLACASSKRDTPSAAQSSDVRKFELTMLVERTDSRKSLWSDESQAVTSKSEMTLFGRVELRQADYLVTYYADSIRFDNREPFEFQTFMSADTMYYRASGGESRIDHRTAEFQSMLSCVFEGPALRIERDESGAPGSTIHLNDDCNSGEYDRINAPVTLGAFLTRVPAHRDRWHERRSLPSYSGVGFHPEIELLYRMVQSSEYEVTVAIAADTTIENHSTLMKNGEEVVIVRDRIRLGGTITVDRSTRLPTSGELRIGESMRMVRPHASGMVVVKEGLYRIRFSLP